MSKKKEAEAPNIMTLDQKADEYYIPTGITELDKALSGGVFRGRITELWGSEGVGKTYIATKIMANLSKDQKVLYIDAEFALNKDRAAALGASPKNIHYVADSRLEKVCELLVSESAKYDVVILDSLVQLTPLTVANAEIGESSIAVFARLIKHWVLKYRPLLGLSNTAFIAINQYRVPFGLYAKNEPPGGKSWHHAVDTRVYLTSNAADKIMEDGQRTGHWVHVEVKKNKTAKPYITTKFKLDYGATKDGKEKL